MLYTLRLWDFVQLDSNASVDRDSIAISKLHDYAHNPWGCGKLLADVWDT